MVLCHADAGDPVHVLFLTDGSRGSWKEDVDPDYVSLREREARAACAFQGTREPEFLRFPDGALRADASLVAAIAGEIERVRPGVIYCPSPLEIHNDHHQAARALLRALEAVPQDPLVMFGEIGAPVPANVLVDVGPVVDRKVEAFRHYASQLAANDYLPPLLGLTRYRTVNIDDPAITCVEAYLAGHGRDLAALTETADRLADLAQRAAPSLLDFCN
jgi:LmbE family N-acetylglucosaminyl deacetylase